MIAYGRPVERDDSGWRFVCECGFVQHGMDDSEPSIRTTLWQHRQGLRHKRRMAEVAAALKAGA